MLLKAKLMVVNGTDESASNTNLASDTIVSVYADCNSKKLKVNINAQIKCETKKEDDDAEKALMKREDML